MTEAKPSLARNRANAERHAFQVVCMARYRARKIIQDRYRAAGRKVYSVPMRELQADADRYLAEHRSELIAQAEIDVAKIMSPAPRKRA